MDKNLIRDMISEVKIPKNEEIKLPKNIIVTVNSDKNVKSVNVEIVSESKRKPYLGGYRNIGTGVKYLNASSQTWLPIKASKDECFTRITQTVWTRQQSQQVCREIFTQTPKNGFYLSSPNDKIISAKYYVNSDEHFENKLQKIKIIQRHFKKYLAKQRWLKLYHQIMENEKQIREKKQKREKEKQKQYELNEKCKIHPQTRADFEYLFNQLQKAYLYQVKKINDTKWGAERLAALSMLTDEEANIIREINAKRKIALENKNAESKIAFLKKAAAPKVWKLTKGEWEVDTVNTLKSQELKDLYYTLTLTYIKRTERIDALLTMIQIVQAYECELTKELINLAQREINLLERGIKDKALRGLHLRILSLFWNYVSHPLFNPQTAQLTNIYSDSSIFKKHLVYCHSCNSYFTVIPYNKKQKCTDVLFYNKKRESRCPRCIALLNEAVHRKNTQIYQHILENLRNKERNLGISTGLVFFLKKSDICYLVEKLWKNQSPLSGNTNLENLVLTRWNRKKEWTPWNNILLTEEEAEVHDKIENISEEYSPELFRIVERKLLQAAMHFSSLPHLQLYIKSCPIHKLSKQSKLHMEFMKTKYNELSSNYNSSTCFNEYKENKMEV